jgi:acyl carrier protein
MEGAERMLSIRERVVSCLLEHVPEPGLLRASVNDDTPIGGQGLGIGSLLLLQVFVRIESELGLTFEDADVANAKFATVGHLVGFIERAAHRDSASLDAS